MILLLDNFDSFTYNLFDYFNQLGVECHVSRNDAQLTKVRNKDMSGLVISPGTGVPHSSGNLMQFIDYYHDKVPILGICLGHQAIGQYFGAKLVKASRPMHGKISELSLKQDQIFKNMPANIRVVRYNSLIVQLEQNESLKPIAFSENLEIMAIKHKNFSKKNP